MSRGSASSRKVSIVVPYETFLKIEYYMKQERMKSFSAMTNRLIEEVLEEYPDPSEPKLPL